MISTPHRGESGALTIRRTENGKLTFAGAEFFTGTKAELLDVIEDLLKQDKPKLIMTPNVNQILDVADNQELRNVFQNCALRIVDGVPLVWLARALGLKNIHRNTGADLLPYCADKGRALGWRIAIAGGLPEHTKMAADTIRTQYPGAEVSAISVPELSSFSQGATDVVQSLTMYRPQLVFMCLGSPQQELWFSHWREDLPAAVYVGAGAAVDFAAGVKKRAPLRLQSAGLEWLWRLSQEPRRLFRRYMVRGPSFIPLAFKSIFEHHVYLATPFDDSCRGSILKVATTSCKRKFGKTNLQWRQK